MFHILGNILTSVIVDGLYMPLIGGGEAAPGGEVGAGEERLDSGADLGVVGLGGQDLLHQSAGLGGHCTKHKDGFTVDNKMHHRKY